MAQYIYTMNRVAKMVPPKKFIIRDISLSFFPGAKIGVLGLNGSGKSTLLKIMAGIDKEFDGEARPQPRINLSPFKKPRKSDNYPCTECKYLTIKEKFRGVYQCFKNNSIT